MKNLKQRLLDESVPLSQRLLTVILNCVIAGALIGFIPMVFGNTEGWWLNLLIMGLALISQIINIAFKKPETATVFLSITGVVIALPLMYFFQGGIASGMSFWLVFATLTAFIMNNGWKRYATVLLAIVIFSGCILVEFLYPETVENLPTKESVYIDTLIGFVSTTIIFLIMLDIYLKAYKRKQNKLDYALHYDALTGIENRYSYESYIKTLNEKPHSDNLIFISADVNSLKRINDTMGHTAGDELLIGAAHVFAQSFGNYGKVFRTGGDEFQAILFTDKDIETIHNDFNSNMYNWKGKLVDELRISIGFACSKDFDTTVYTELSKAADQAMYKDKAVYYQQSGINRRLGY